jgi:hypothetical protein
MPKGFVATSSPAFLWFLAYQHKKKNVAKPIKQKLSSFPLHPQMHTFSNDMQFPSNTVPFAAYPTQRCGPIQVRLPHQCRPALQRFEEEEDTRV